MNELYHRQLKYVQKEIKKTTEYYSEHLFETYRNTLLGIDEAIKKLWTIVDSQKTEAKEKVKAITLMRSEPSLLQQKKYMDETKILSRFDQ